MKYQVRNFKVAFSEHRVQRLYRLVHLLATGQSTRRSIIHRLRIDERNLYRDFDVLEQLGIRVVHGNGRYCLAIPLPHALKRLPLPNPMLTVDDALRLARGRSPSHRKLSQFVRGLLRATRDRNTKNHRNNHVRYTRQELVS